MIHRMQPLLRYVFSYRVLVYCCSTQEHYRVVPTVPLLFDTSLANAEDDADVNQSEREPLLPASSSSAILVTASLDNKNSAASPCTMPRRDPTEILEPCMDPTDSQLLSYGSQGNSPPRRMSSRTASQIADNGMSPLLMHRLEATARN